MPPNPLPGQSLSPLPPPPASVLDLGCGTGSVANALAGRGYSVRAIDPDGDAVETARELGASSAGTAHFSVARGESLPFPDEAFDAVLCIDVLHWAADAAAFDAIWNEAWRVLRPGGLLVARLLCRDAFQDADPLGGGRFRLATGAEWFLAGMDGMEARVIRAGGGMESAPAEEKGKVLLTARKPA